MRLGEILIREGLITSSELERALQRGEQQKVRLGTALVELGLVDVDTIARALSAMHQVPAVLSKQNGLLLSHATTILLLGRDYANTDQRVGLNHSDSIMILRTRSPDSPGGSTSSPSNCQCG